MINKTVSQIKDTIRNFYKTAQDIRKEQDFNKNRYAPDVAREQNSELISKLSDETEKSKNLIAKIYSETLRKLSVLSAPNSAELDCNDYWLLSDMNYNANERDFAIIIDRNKDQFTFLRAVKNIAEDKDIAVRINLPEDKVKVYQEIAQSAITLIEKIALSPSVTQSEVESFADPEFGKNLFQVIGDGKELHTVSLNGKSELETNTFDVYKLDLTPLSVPTFTAQL